MCSKHSPLRIQRLNKQKCIFHPIILRLARKKMTYLIFLWFYSRRSMTTVIHLELYVNLFQSFVISGTALRINVSNFSSKRETILSFVEAKHLKAKKRSPRQMSGNENRIHLVIIKISRAA